MYIKIYLVMLEDLFQKLSFRYKHDVDKNMTVLKLVDAEEKDIGMIR